MDNGGVKRRAVLQGDAIVPARSEVDVPVRVVLGSLSGDVTGDSSRHVCWSTQPTSVSTGVHVSRTIIPSDRLVDIPVRVLKVQKAPAMLRGSKYCESSAGHRTSCSERNSCTHCYIGCGSAGCCEDAGCWRYQGRM